MDSCFVKKFFTGGVAGKNVEYNINSALQQNYFLNIYVVKCEILIGSFQLV